MSQPPWPAPPSRSSPRRTLFVALALAAVGALVVVTLTVATVLVLRPLVAGPGQDPAAGPAGGSADPAGLGDLGRALAAAGYQCTVELADPLITGCYYRQAESRSLRWRGPADQPAALSAYVLSTQTSDYDHAGEMDTLLSHLERTGVWTADDRAAVRARLGLAEGEQAEVETSWGRVTLDRSPVILTLKGVRTGADVQPVVPKEFPTPIDELDERATALGYRCQQVPDREDRLCTRGGNTRSIAISTGDQAAATSLYARSPDPDGLPDLVTLARAAAPADADVLAGLIDQAGRTTSIDYRAGNGWIVLCQQRDGTNCSIYGVGWDD